MIVEVTGTNTWNKGAELMMVAIRQRFDQRHPDIDLAVDTTFGSYKDRVKYNLYFKPGIRRWGRSKVALRLMRSSFRRSLGIVGDEEIGAVLDAAGFAFGDQHGAERTVSFAEDLAAARRAGKKIVMLPQALGPFEQPRIRDAFGRIVDACDRLYARDRVSFEHARRAAGNDERIRLAPDFTNLIKTPCLSESNRHRRACIVPNQRMVEKAESQKSADNYLPMLNHFVAAVENEGLEPVLLIHGREDVGLGEALQKTSRKSLDVICESDPLRIKEEIGSSFLVIASRFHALVSALSQCVPAIGTSWSHKYEMLFSDYGCSEFLLPVEVPKDKIFECVRLATGAQRVDLVDTLRTKGHRLVQRALRMWEEVDNILFGEC
jgi:colanic acid/amylovoran biosynthesis protein